MKIKHVNSHDDLLKAISDSKRSYLLLYKPGSEQSDCALLNLEKAANESDEILLLAADVSKIRDIHTKYEISSAPSLLEFEEKNFKKVIKGCHDWSYFKSIFDNAVVAVQAAKSGKTIKSVTVYSTPTCSWCTRLKDYLRKHKIIFRDVDVSRDQKAADDLVKRSGQQGVPQTDINGQIIVGFDKPKINELLDIQE